MSTSPSSDFANRTAFRAVAFDCDGTLVDSFQAIADSVNYVRARHGLAPLPEAKVRRHVGHGLKYLLDRVLLEPDFERDAAAYREHHPTVMLAGTTLLPGAIETVRWLKEQGLAVAICSNKPIEYTLPLVEHLGLGPMLSLVLGPESVAHAKPAPDMIHAVMDKLSLSASEILYVGDMTIDIETARAAGVAVWVVPTGTADRDTLLAARPDRLLSSLAEMAQLIRPRV